MEVDKKHQVQNRWLQVIIFLSVYCLSNLALGQLLPKADGIINSLFIPVALGMMLSIVITLVFTNLIFGKDPLPVGLNLSGHARSAIAGACLGWGLIGTGTMIMYAMQWIHWNEGEASGAEVFIMVLLLAGSAFGEELVFRGIILRRLMEATNRMTALIVSSTLFAMFHIGNPDISLIALLNIFTGGLMLGITYSYTKNLWFGWMLHFSWNLAQGPLLGFAVSGLKLPSLVTTTMNGPVLLTGGDFGPEGSLIMGLLIIVNCIVLLVINRRQSVLL